jgi:hypothetical protein
VGIPEIRNTPVYASHGNPDSLIRYESFHSE